MTTSTTQGSTIDEPSAGPADRGTAFLTFLEARLCEEAGAATRRQATGSPERADRADREVDLVNDLIADLRAGRPLDPTTRQLLIVAYGRHPQFRPEWFASDAWPDRG